MPENGPRSPRRLRFSLETSEPTSFGYGWISGVGSATLGVIGLGAVLCFHFPSLLTMPELRALYPVPAIRAALQATLVAAFVLGVLSLYLRHNKALGSVGIGLTLAALLLGGSRVPIDGELRTGPFLGLDWFLLNLMAYSVIYVPLERLFARDPGQPTFRAEWQVDLVYFFLNSIFVQALTLLTLSPAVLLFDWARVPGVQTTIASIPLAIQIPAALLVADFTQYWVHRAYHRVPLLWRFHAVHHSARNMDWLAGSRLHLLDAIPTRALTYAPLYVLGFSEAAIYAYVSIVVVQATFIHANVSWELRPLQRIVATPRFHHWHHTAEPDAIDRNFAVHTPLWDWLFGTYHLPQRWPSQYGLGPGQYMPASWTLQLLYPFRRSER